MKKALIALVAAICILLVVVIVQGQSSGSGSFSGTVGTTPFSGTFTTSTTDPCSSSAVAKSSVAVVSGMQDLVVASSATSIHICGFGLARISGGSQRFSYGTFTQCLSGTGTLLTGGLITTTDTAPFIAGNNNQTILSVPSGNDLCSNGEGQGFLTYVQR